MKKMEVNNKLSPTSKQSKQLAFDMTDMSILSAPIPQACSTVQRKTAPSAFQKYSNDVTDGFEKYNESSFGLLNNISNLLGDPGKIDEPNSAVKKKIETERELARQLLQRCSDNSKFSSTFDPNKENNVNTQNLSSKSAESTASVESLPKENTNNALFDQREFTAQSLEMSNNSNSYEKNNSLPSKNRVNDFTFNSTAAELMAKFSDNEFMSGPSLLQQLSADELVWRENYNPIPITPVKKENIDLSCFSGIIGDLDLSIESCPGHKVSVNEYFSRKCGVLGKLTETSSVERPTFGLDHINSPQRILKQALLNPSYSINETTACTSITDSSNVTSTDDSYVMSLSKIAEALQNADGTPRRLVDQLLMAKRRQKNDKQSNINMTSETYTINNDRQSLINASTSTATASDVEQKSTAKLSLDSKIQKDIFDKSKYNSTNTTSNYKSSKSMEELSKMSETLKSNEKLSMSPRQTKLVVSHNDFTDNINNINHNSCNNNNTNNNINNMDNVTIKQELNSTMFNRSSGKIIIGKNTQDLYKCIVGVSRDADIEIENGSERWLTCSLKLLQIQGDKSNIEIDIPSEPILIEPNKSKTLKVIVKLINIGDPIMAALTVKITDMTTREVFTKQHMMCFIPDKSKPVDTQSSSSSSLLTDNNKEISIIDNDVPFILKKNEQKYLKLKNITNDTISNIIALIQSDESHHNFTIEPNKITLKCNEVMNLLLTYHNHQRTSDGYSNSNGDKHAILKIKTDKYVYTYPIIGKNELMINENRSETPQQLISRLNGQPSSPQSITSSSKSGRNSPHSTASCGTVAGDNIPIKSTHSTLIWTSVRVGKYETREFTIRNISNNKIKLQGIITDNNFRFLKDRESSTTITIGLQHMESKTFTVMFSPNNTGPISGKITFLHYDKRQQQQRDESSSSSSTTTRVPSRIIPLYGYGGYAKVSIGQALKMIGDQLWLSLGKLNQNCNLNGKIKLENSGDLSSFVKISLTPKAVYPSVESSWHIEPSEFILGPKGFQWITIVFKPRKNDITLIRGDVADVGTLTITHGDEPTRWRIRRLYKKLFEAGQTNDNFNSNSNSNSNNNNRQQDDIFKKIVYPLCKVFPDEVPIYNLNILRDSVQDLGLLCCKVNRHVITLTVELNSDDTVSIFADDDDYDANESQMFQSLCSDISTVFNSLENSYMPSELMMDNNNKKLPAHKSNKLN